MKYYGLWMLVAGCAAYRPGPPSEGPPGSTAEAPAPSPTHEALGEPTREAHPQTAGIASIEVVAPDASLFGTGIGGGGIADGCMSLYGEPMPSVCPEHAKPCPSWRRIDVDLRFRDAASSAVSDGLLDLYKQHVQGCLANKQARKGRLMVRVEGPLGSCPSKVSVTGTFGSARERACMRNAFRYNHLSSSSGADRFTWDGPPMRFAVDIDIAVDSRDP